MQTQFTTPRGANVTLTVKGTIIAVSVEGRGEFQARELLGGFVMLHGSVNKIEVPASARASVKAAFDLRNDAIGAEYRASADYQRERMYARMYGRNSIH